MAVVGGDLRPAYWMGLVGLAQGEDRWLRLGVVTAWFVDKYHGVRLE